MDIQKEDYQKAVAVVRKCLSGSVSNLQRKLYWGYGRAASAIDRMQDEFIVSPMSASGRRDVYPEEIHELWQKLQAAKASVPEGFVLVPRIITDEWMEVYVDQVITKYCVDYEDTPHYVRENELPELREDQRLPIRRAHERLMQVIVAQEPSNDS